QVDPEWRMFFEGVEFAQKNGSPGASGGTSQGLNQKELNVYELIRDYRRYGHLKAKIDPLGLKVRTCKELDLEAHNLTEKDLDSVFEVGSLIGLKGGGTLRAIVEILERTYCGTFAVEYMDCDPDVVLWMRNQVEKRVHKLDTEGKKEVLEVLTKTEALERFIHTRFVGAKRFSIEGGDALLPMMEHLLQIGVKDGLAEVVIGMAHRGRVNMLATYCHKPLDLIFAEFEGAQYAVQGYNADGDVKYHMGFSTDREAKGKKVHLSMAFNPSHLEAVDPVVCGMARAKQRLRKDNKERKTVIPVQVHGDAAFIGQGVVAETLQMSGLEGYTVGGSIHLVINNQVGFTTSPEYSRTSTYCTDVAKMLRIPIFHVNGDDVEACMHAMNIAYHFRQTFGRDVVI
ncbi:MAG: 2-oxoglutarate dehydrogenase subunit E1, partial [Proteobacteria bacterium]